MSTTTPARKLFTLTGSYGGSHENCCACCNGYCPQPDRGWDPGQLDLFRLSIRGADYLSDRYAAILADRVQLDPADENIDVKDAPVSAGQAGQEGRFPVPANVPGESDEIFHPATIHGIIAAGYTIRQGEPRLEWTGEKLPYPPDTGRPQYIYDGDQHIGWVMPLNSGDGVTCRLKDVPRIAQYAEEAEAHGWNLPILDGADPWFIAASILNEAKRIQAMPS